MLIKVLYFNCLFYARITIWPVFSSVQVIYQVLDDKKKKRKKKDMFYEVWATLIWQDPNKFKKKKNQLSVFSYHHPTFEKTLSNSTGTERAGALVLLAGNKLLMM